VRDTAPSILAHVRVLSPEQAAHAPETAAGLAVTIGAYDGVHLGHRHLLGLLRAEAARLGVFSAVVTFDRHPATVVRPESAPELLTDAEQKLELLADCGIDVTVIVPFDAQRANEGAEEFVDEVLVGACRARAVVVGEDFHFGHGRKGDVGLLRELGATRGFEVVAVGLQASGAEGPVSSTRVRGLLAAGDVSGAAALLGRPFQVRGIVVRGDGRGAGLGMPTANLSVPGGLALPAVGIYAGACRRPDGSSNAAAISVGLRPTFSDPGAGAAPEPLVEAHLIDFVGDLYGERVALCFFERLRDERRFDAVGDLVDQMRVDVGRARDLAEGRTC
jgi:riboflavin kinase/FMN adenylyltransferase